MKIEAHWRGRRHFTAEGPSGVSVHMDAATDVGGQGQGARPMELLLMGLAGCTGIDVTLILERMRENLEQLDIEVEGTRRDEYPQAFTEIAVTYKMLGNIPPAKAWRAIDLSEQKYCSATASLNAKITPTLILNGIVVPHENTATPTPSD